MTSKPKQQGTYATLLSRTNSKHADEFISAIFGDVLAWERAHSPRQNERGSKAIERFRECLERFIGDLLTAQANAAGDGAIWHSLSTKAFKGHPVGIRDFKHALRALVGLKLVEWLVGKGRFLGWEGEALEQLKGKASRYVGAPALLRRAEDAGVAVASIDEHFRQEAPSDPLVLKTGSIWVRNVKIVGKRIGFHHTARSRQFETRVRELNEFTLGLKIDGAVHAGGRRIFNEGDDPTSYEWNKGGRLFSVWPLGRKPYQALSSAERARITINGETTAEIDIRACNLTLYHAKLGVPFDTDEDPYERTGLEREVAKAWIVASFGADKPISRWSTTASEEYREKTGHALSDHCTARKAGRRMLEAYPALSNIGEPGVTWADLMFLESQVVSGAMEVLMRMWKIPSLPVHDSLIVPFSKLELASGALLDSFRGVVGVYPFLASKNPEAQATLEASMRHRRHLLAFNI